MVDIATLVTLPIYSVLSAVGIVGNSLILLVGITNRKMRTKEYHLPYLLASTELLLCLAVFSAAVARSFYFIKEYQDDCHYTKIQCLYHPHSLLFIFGEAGVPAANWAICIDRLIAISNPMLYYSLTTRYTKRMCAFVGGTLGIYCFSVLTLSFYEAVNDTDTCVVAECWTNDAYNAPLYNVMWYFVGFSGFGQIILIVVMLVLFLTTEASKAKLRAGGVPDMVRKRNEKVTRMLLYTLVISVFFSCIPWAQNALAVLGYIYDYEILIYITAIMMVINSLNNVFIYFFKNSDMRAAIKGLFGIRGNTVFVSTRSGRTEPSMHQKF